MADHGPRLDDLRYKTLIGEHEDNNPFFMLTVPESVRKNAEIMGTLKQNSQKLITHLDTYQTMLEIRMNVDEKLKAWVGINLWLFSGFLKPFALIWVFFGLFLDPFWPIIFFFSHLCSLTLKALSFHHLTEVIAYSILCQDRGTVWLCQFHLSSAFVNSIRPKWKRRSWAFGWENPWLTLSTRICIVSEWRMYAKSLIWIRTSCLRLMKWNWSLGRRFMRFSSK